MSRNQFYPYNTVEKEEPPDTLDSVRAKYVKEYLEALKSESRDPQMFMMGGKPRLSSYILEGLRAAMK